MLKKEVHWFSFPFIAPKGKGSRPKKPEGEIFEIESPPESASRRPRHDDPINLTPQERRKRIVALLAIGLSRWAAEQKKRSEGA